MDSETSTDTRLLVLLGLRLKGFADPEAIAEVVGLDPSQVRTELGSLVDEGLVRFNEQRQVYVLDPETGRPEGERLLARELEVRGTRPAVDGAYRAFLDLNSEMLQLCTDWQIRSDLEPQTLNDHTDEDYDEQVISRLVDIDDRLRLVLAELEAAAPRFGTYRGRFGEALDRVLAGETEYFTKPVIPSYHTVWFELHEDLLASLGIDRASERSD